MYWISVLFFAVCQGLIDCPCQVCPCDDCPAPCVVGGAPDRGRAKAKAKALLFLDQDRRAREQVSREDPTCGCGYDDAVLASKKSGAPLVLVVGGAKRPDLDDAPWKVLHVPSGCHALPEGIIVSKGGNWLKTLPTTATVQEIGDALRPRQVSYLAPPMAAPPMRVVSASVSC